MITSFDDVKFKRVNDEIEEDIETNADFTVDDLQIFNRDLARESLSSIKNKNKVKIGNLMKISLDRFSTPSRRN